MNLTGAVPDVRPFLAHAALVAAPLRIAQGVPNKVLEAMAMAKAVVATPAAIAGLRLRPGQEILIAETPAAFAEAVISLLDPQRAAALGARARARVVADYAWEFELSSPRPSDRRPLGPCRSLKADPPAAVSARGRDRVDRATGESFSKRALFDRDETYVERLCRAEQPQAPPPRRQHRLRPDRSWDPRAVTPAGWGAVGRCALHRWRWRCIQPMRE